jgi:hypothetical protein
MEMNGKTHEWRFFRAGGFDQVRIETGADLQALAGLDQKLWVALSCPTRGIEFDEHTLDLIDGDRDGHIRAPEIIAAVNWALGVLKDADLLARGADHLPLSAIDETSEEGAKLLAAARHILAGLGKPDAEAVCASDTEDTARLMAGLRFNGDGVIVPQAVSDEAARRAVEEIMACCGAVPDCGGEPGVARDSIGRFFAQVRDYDAWRQRGEQSAEILFLGASSLAAADCWRAVRAKVDDYFVRCQMATFDARAALPLSRSLEDYQLLASRELSVAADEVAAFPLALVAAGRDLPLEAGINPAWQQAIAALRTQVVTPLLGVRAALSLAEWQALSARFAALDAWLADKPVTQVETLGAERLRELRACGVEAELLDLVARQGG